MPDVLLDAGRRLKTPLTPALPWQTFEEMLQAPAAEPAPRRRRPRRAAPERRGAHGVARARSSTAAPASIRSTSCPTPSQAFFDGSLAHLPWLQELPDPLTSAMWSSWVEINVQDGRHARHRRRRHRGGRLGARHAARAGRHLAGHRARRRGDAGRAGPRDVHPLRERPRRQSARHPGAGRRTGDRPARVGGHAREDHAGRRAPTAV